MIERKISEIIKRDSNTYSVIGITGPRQTGKTTLVKHLFPEMHYANLEDLSQKEFALEDPKSFLTQGDGGMIIDEIQKVPALLSYIQVIVDEKQKPGMFIITGSQNLLLMEKISQSLAGRISLFTLLPFSLQELYKNKTKPPLNEVMFKGFYPGLYARDYEISGYYRNYINTYIERDVRQLKNITDLKTFQNLIRLCAGRAGQILNYSSIGDDLGVSHNTVKAWISILEASYIIRLLQPYFSNFNKQIIKMPKMYFNDTGLLCSLLGIDSCDQIDNHYLKGGIFENFVVSEFRKYFLNNGKEDQLFFWRDKRGREIDLLIDRKGVRTILEMKSGSTISGTFFKNLEYYQDLDTGSSPETSYLIYGGSEFQNRSAACVRGWENLVEIEKNFF
ncbi:MAG TPA: AAA family ATPase [Spirochaeta sp.]|nr:AAA family ATPase [Spirochaeta sp.]